MTQIVGKGPRQQVKGLSERVSSQENSLARVLVGINQRFQAIDLRMAKLEDQLNALIELLGEEKSVADLLAAKQLEKLKAEAQAEKASLEEGVTNGYVIPSDKVEDRSLIVGFFTGKDGKVQEPGRAQLVMPGLAPKFKDQLVGQAAGFELVLPNETKFTITEIYGVDDKKYSELMAERQKKAVEQAAARAKEAAEADEKKDADVPAEAIVETGAASPELL